MMGTLEKLLERIRDGRATPGEVGRARELVVHDARLPDDLREIGLTDADDLIGDAVGLLAVLGAAPLFDDELREALSDEASEAMVGADDLEDPTWEPIATALREGLVAAADGVEVVHGVMARLPAPEWVYGPITAEAVRGEAGTVDVAGEAMSHLGDHGVPVAEAVAAESGTVDVAGAVFAELGLEAGLSVADAVAVESGTVDVVGAVFAELELAAGLSVAEAVAAESGTVEVAGAVFAELELAAGLSVADAVAAEAGTADVVDGVLAALREDASLVAEAVTSEAGSVDVVEPVQAEVAPQPSVLHEAPKVPAAANRGWTWGAVAMAAVALLMVGLSQLPGMGGGAPADMEFAGAGELVVEDLEFADDVVVMQAEGDEGAVILWMEDV